MEMHGNISEFLPFDHQCNIQNPFDLDAVEDTVKYCRMIFWPHGGLYAYSLVKVSS